MFWISNTSQKNDLEINGARLQSLALITQILKSGAISLSTNDKQLIQLTVKNKNIDLNIFDAKFLKDLLENDSQTKSFLELLRQLKTLAEELKDQGITVTISFNEITIVTIGSDAKSKISRLITGTKQIEINNLKKLVRIALS